MSSDNVIYIIPFRRDDNAVVHRVCEVQISGVEHKLLKIMQNKEKYEEYEGPESYKVAKKAARQWRKRLDSLEYGIADYAAEPVDMKHFEDKAASYARGYV